MDTNFIKNFLLLHFFISSRVSAILYEEKKRNDSLTQNFDFEYKVMKDVSIV